MLHPTILDRMRKLISSLESEFGATLCVTPAGLTIAPCGQALVLASLSASQPSRTCESASTTIATCGRFGSISLASANLCNSLASKLEAKTALNGSTLFSITWKVKTTPAGRQLPVQQVRVLTTSESAFTSLPTPCARDGRDISRSNAFLSALKRHSPSLATRLLESGLPWPAITSVYCLAMCLPLQWNVHAPKATVTRSTRNKQKSSSK